MSLVEDWLQRGNWKTIDSHKVFYQDSASNKPVICILHGYPTSSFDYYRVFDNLSRHFRVIVHDHLGYGASDKPENYSYSLIDQADIAFQLWQELGVEECFVVAHDYGTSVATELMVRDNLKQMPINLNGFVMSNGSVHIEFAKLRLIQKLLRRPKIGPIVASLTSYRTFKVNMQKIFHNSELAIEEELQAHWELMNKNNGRTVLPKISQYTFERFKFWQRWIGALKATEKSIDLIWARQDPVAVPKIAEAIHRETQSSTLKWLNECGHFPMLEKSEEWAEAVIQAIEVRLSLKSH